MQGVRHAEIFFDPQAHLKRGVPMETVIGGLHSAPTVMWSVDFAGIEALQRAGDWDEAARQLGEHARGVERAGAA